MSTDTISVTYTLWSVPSGYYYIGLDVADFDAIGNDRWEGRIEANEKRAVTFVLKMKESILDEIKDKLRLSIGFSPRPYRNYILNSESESIMISLKDYDSIKSTLSPFRGGSNVRPGTPVPYDSINKRPMKLWKHKKGIRRDSSNLRHKTGAVTEDFSVTCTIPSFHFKDPTNSSLPLHDFQVEIWAYGYQCSIGIECSL